MCRVVVEVVVVVVTHWKLHKDAFYCKKFVQISFPCTQFCCNWCFHKYVCQWKTTKNIYSTNHKTTVNVRIVITDNSELYWQNNNMDTVLNKINPTNIVTNKYAIQQTAIQNKFVWKIEAVDDNLNFIMFTVGSLILIYDASFSNSIPYKTVERFKIFTII